MRGIKPERWVRQTDFSNDEAVGFLADRLNRLGVEDRLLALGAEEGDAVLIGEADNAVVFDFRPDGRDRGGAARPPGRGRTPRGVPSRRRSAAATSTPRWPTARRARRAPTWPDGSGSRLDDPTTVQRADPDWGWTEDDPGEDPAEDDR